MPLLHPVRMLDLIYWELLCFRSVVCHPPLMAAIPFDGSVTRRQEFEETAGFRKAMANDRHLHIRFTVAVDTILQSVDVKLRRHPPKTG